MKDNAAPQVVRSNLLIRTIRSRSYIYSPVCKSRLFYSRNIAAVRQRIAFRKLQHSLFSMNSFEKRHCQELTRTGFTVLADFFDPNLIDSIYKKADTLFRNAKVDLYDAYSVQNKQRLSLMGLTYQELEASEKMIALKDPLLNVRECLPIAFNESILKIITNFLKYVPPIFKPMIVRDFPSDRPRESSNFHRDNDESDSVQFFVYLVDIDDTRGPLVYIPRTNRYDVKSCRPRLSRDLGINDSDGRVSDKEMEKYYSRNSWITLKVKRGCAVIMHANGFHKGPSWPNFGDSRNKPRTALRFDLAGYKMGGTHSGQERKIAKQDYSNLSAMQRLFTKGFTIVEDNSVSHQFSG